MPARTTGTAYRITLGKAALIADDKTRCAAWADAFSRGVPSARIVLIPKADHYVYLSNAAQVITEMNAFLATLH